MKPKNLWSSDDCAAWDAALESYPDVLRSQQVNGLEELDVWCRQELPRLLAERRPTYITRDELESVTKWKMKRGVWRERNRLLVIGNPAGEVRKTAQAAFAAVPDTREPIKLFSQLAGVGPATASAVLAAFRPDLFPFFDDLVAAQIPGLGPVAFTAAYYQRYAARLRERAEELNQACKNANWTAHAVGQALWANSGGKVAQ